MSPHRSVLLVRSPRERLERIHRKDALEVMDRIFVLEVFTRGESICMSRRHGVWD